MTAVIVLAIFGAVYFLPTIIASNRHRVSIGGILAVNLFFGWTLIGWVIALAWALSGNANTAQSLAAMAALRKCPSCAETIQWEAIVCRFCGRDVPRATAANAFIGSPSYYDPNTKV